jgi:formate-dependent nitrite reductase cytochrome c552 subunit
VPVPFRTLGALLLTWLALAPARAAEPVGAETCKVCHPAAYEIWRESAHARAWLVLPERSRNDVRCTACHAPEGATAQAGVSCETCHGNGQLYSPPFVMRDRELARALGLLDAGEKTCLRCHDDSSPSLTRFDYSRKLPLVEHGRADREASRAAGARPAPPAGR